MNLEEALNKIADDRKDIALQKQLKKSAASSSKQTRDKPKKPRNDFPTAQWSLSPKQLEAVAHLALLSAFDRPLGCKVLTLLVGNEAQTFFDLLVNHTALTPLGEGYFCVIDALRTTITPDVTVAKAIMPLVVGYLQGQNSLPLPLVLAYQSLSLITKECDEAMQGYLELFESHTDPFVHEGIHTQIIGFINTITDTTQPTLPQAKALYIHALEMLHLTPTYDKIAILRYVTLLERVSAVGSGEQFEADAAKHAGITYRKRLNNLPKSREMHRLALRLSQPNRYPRIAAFSHLELGKLESEYATKKSHFEESLRLGVETKRQEQQAMAHHELGDLERSHHPQEAQKHYRISIQLREAIGDPEGYIRIIKGKLREWEDQ